MDKSLVSCFFMDHGVHGHQTDTQTHRHTNGKTLNAHWAGVLQVLIPVLSLVKNQLTMFPACPLLSTQQISLLDID